MFSSRRFSLSAFGLSIALGGAFLVAPLPRAHAQPARKIAPQKTPLPLPMILGGALGGLVVGAGLGWALKKNPSPVAVDPGPGRAFENAPFPLAIIDSKERVARANAAFASFLGAPAVVGQALPQFFHPDDLAALRVGIQSVFDGDRADFATQTRLFRPDGTLLHARFLIQKEGDARKPHTVLLALQDTTAHVAAQSDAVGARDAVGALYGVIGGDRARSLDAKMKALLQMGCAQLELPIGALSRVSVDDAGEKLETLFVQSPDRRVRPAMTLRRADWNAHAPWVEAELLGLDLLPHPHLPPSKTPIERNEKGAYLGVPVKVEDKLFGVLSFAALEARAQPFEAGDTELLQLMAEWVGGEIERENARAVLAQQQRELLRANGKLESLATHDGLTEAKNRRAFNDKLAEEWSRAQRYGTPLSLVMFDVDKFKSYNDTYGHQAGDNVLKILARTVMGLVRTTDFFARYGGEEFALILPNTDAEGAYVLAERLRERVEKANWKERPVTASFGVASLEESLSCGEDLIERADAALYQSKERGRNRVTQSSEAAVGA